MTTAIIVDAKENVLAQYGQAKDKLEEVAAKHRGVTIAGLNDREGYLAAKKALAELSTPRIAIEKKRKELKAYYLEGGKLVDSVAKELTAITATVEDSIHAQVKAIDDEKKRIEEAAFQKRLDSLKAIDVMMDPAAVKAMSDEEFAELLTRRTAEFQAEKARLEAEETERKRVEAEAAEARRVEEARIAAERAELEELRRQQAEAQAKIDAENRRVEQERLDREREVARFQAEQEAALQAERDKIEAERAAVAAEKARVEKAEQDRLARIELDKAISAAAEKARLEEAARIQAKKEADEAERVRQEAMKPDREKLASVADLVLEIEVPEVGANLAPARALIISLLKRASVDIADVANS